MHAGPLKNILLIGDASSVLFDGELEWHYEILTASISETVRLVVRFFIIY